MCTVRVPVAKVLSYFQANCKPHFDCECSVCLFPSMASSSRSMNPTDKKFSTIINQITKPALRTYVIVNFTDMKSRHLSFGLYENFRDCRNCFASSPRRPDREYKRMVFEHTHGLFIT